jgi:DNA-binding NarL/FixJ family response regulator
MAAFVGPFRGIVSRLARRTAIGDNDSQDRSGSALAAECPAHLRLTPADEPAGAERDPSRRPHGLQAVFDHRGYAVTASFACTPCDWSNRIMTIKVLIADDHALVRDGLRHILTNASGFEVAGEACDGASTIALVRSTDAQVLVLDLSMPGRTGVELIKQVKEEKPAMRILVLTMHAEHQYAARAFKAGASGYLTKESASAELVAAVSKVAAGGVYVSLAMAERFAQSLTESTDALPHQRLSDREFEETITQIGEALCVSVKTVSTYKARIFEKMQMPHEAALVRYSMRHKLFDDNEEV